MRSIRTKITLLTLAAILISILSFGMIGIYFIIDEITKTSTETMNLICENRKDALNEYLNSIKQSVNMISRYATDSLDGVALTAGGVLGATGNELREMPGRSDAQKESMDRYLDEHLAFIENAFRSIANHTNGISSCFYRINPEITTTKKGFLFSKKGASDFEKIELTDIELYAPDDFDHVGWYYIPLRQGRPSWVAPYESEKLGETVLSYSVPIYKAGTFIGVLGMEIDYNTLVTEIRRFTNFRTGYFTLTDGNAKIYYHPQYERGTEIRTVLPQVLDAVSDMHGDSSSKQLIRYRKDGKDWRLTYSTLVNGMKLVAIVEESEINAATYNLTRAFLLTGAVILVLFVILTTLVMKRVTRPLANLTTAAKRLAVGDYDVTLDYKDNDEVGVLVDAFRTMRDRLKVNFNDLSNKAFRDDLTGVKSKHAYFEAEENLDQRIREGSISEFAVVLFDLNDLKRVNDSYGHEAGDEHIKSASRIICTQFAHSPVYRIGGDEFVALLKGSDYENREALLSDFERQMDDNMKNGRITIASGDACFDPEKDMNYHTVFKRADEKMYLRKKQMKENIL
ncbi:MAG: diguanylate cyclase [Clostridia bacterium]|nr:diguanylate cyclase [Clostridia bacterium]